MNIFVTVAMIFAVSFGAYAIGGTIGYYAYKLYKITKRCKK